MLFLKSALMGLMTAVISGAAWSAASDPNIAADVTAVPQEVTLQRTGLGPLAAYQVTLTNDTTNALNRVKFTGSALLSTDTDPDPVPINIDSVVLVSAQDDPNCSIDANGVSCEVGSLAPKADMVFFVVVKAPLEGSSIAFNWTFRGAEGNSLTGQSFAVITGLASTVLTDALSTTGKTKAKSFVPSASGVTLFTGANSGAAGVIGSPATPADPYTTTVVVPTGVTTTAAINETETPVLPCQVGACYSSQLAIPGTFPSFLKIFLRRDGSTMSGNIKNAVIFYTPDGTLTPIQVPACDSLVGGVPASNSPCIKRRIEYTRSNSPLPIEDWVKDWEFEIWALDNGKYEQ